MKKNVDAIRFLGLDMINKANSGHPGIVLGAAPVMYSMYQYHLNATPLNPTWFNRDRFFLAAGHGSALLYATLHLAGYQISIEDLKEFRQLHSKTPGHPEYRHTEGVDATTGPLGQGIAMAVGSAIAESYLRNTFNRDELSVIDHYTYALCGDGDLQEGVTLEALSLAGHLELERLIILFDSNDIQLDGPTANATTENIKMKMESMGYYYQLVEDANDILAVSIAIEKAKHSNKPSFIEIKSVIGFGSSKQGTSATHGAPLGAEETIRMKKAFDYSTKPFEVLSSAYDEFKNRFGKRGEQKYNEWLFYVEKYEKQFPELYHELKLIMDGVVSIPFDELLPMDEIGYVEATRNSIGKIIPKCMNASLALMGGSADLAGSTKVKGINGNYSYKTPVGRNINFGVREHAMAAIVNGMSLHHLKAFSGGFFVFSDYMKPSIRLAALMQTPSIFIFTHDSIAVGEDGPTHEPVEQLAMFRSLPNIHTFRPANANETKLAFRMALEETRMPSVICLTRQDTKVMNEVTYDLFKQGAYVAKDMEDFEGILIATGSEVELAIQTQEKLYQDHQIKVRVVSMPSMDLFLKQPKHIQEAVLPKNITKRLAIEMGSPYMWYQFASNVKGIDTFGVSANGNDAMNHFGFNVDGIVKEYLNIGK